MFVLLYILVINSVWNQLLKIYAYNSMQFSMYNQLWTLETEQTENIYLMKISTNKPKWIGFEKLISFIDYDLGMNGLLCK